MESDSSINLLSPQYVIHSRIPPPNPTPSPMEIETEDTIPIRSDPELPSWKKWLDELRATATSPTNLNFWTKYSMEFYQEFASILGPCIIKGLEETVEQSEEIFFLLNLMEYLMERIGDEFINIWGKELEKFIPLLYQKLSESERWNLMQNYVAGWNKYFPRSKLIKLRVQCLKISNKELVVALESKAELIVNLKSSLENHEYLINFKENEIGKLCERLNLMKREIGRKTNGNEQLETENRTLSEELIKLEIEIAQKSTENAELGKEIESQNSEISALKAKIKHQTEIICEVLEKNQEKNQIIQTNELEISNLKNEIIYYTQFESQSFHKEKYRDKLAGKESKIMVLEAELSYYKKITGAAPILEDSDFFIQIRNLNREISEAKEKIRHLENELQEKEKLVDVDYQTKLIANLQKTNSIKDTKIFTYMLEIQRLKDENMRNHEIFELSCNGFLQKLQNDSIEIQRLKNELEIEKSEKFKANEDAEEIHRDFERIENENSNLTQQIEAFRARTLEYQKLQNDSNEIQRLQNELEIEKNEKFKANEDAEEIHRDFERIENENSNLTQQIEAFRARALKYQRIQHKLQTQYHKTVEELKIIRNERNALIAERYGEKKHCFTINETKYKSKLRAKNEELEKRLQKIKQQKSQIEQRTKLVISGDKQIGQLKMKIIELESEVKFHKQKFDQMHSILKSSGTPAFLLIEKLKIELKKQYFVDLVDITNNEEVENNSNTTQNCNVNDNEVSSSSKCENVINCKEEIID